MLIRLLKSFKLSVYILLLFFSPGLSLAEVNINIPKEVKVGDPFLLEITSKESFRFLKIRWDGKSVMPSLTKEKDIYRSEVILGVSLITKPGLYPIFFSYKKGGTFKNITNNILVVEKRFRKEKLRVRPKLIKPPKKLMNRLKREREALLKGINTISPVRFWRTPFFRPVKGIKLSRFGLHRTFNNETKRRHRGLDFRAWKGTPIHSMARGKVVLTGHYYFAGKFALIDHGNGLISFYCHMSKLLVKKGSFVRSGNKIGLSGDTGRVNGAHLHLSVYSLGKVINPEPFFDGSL